MGALLGPLSPGEARGAAAARAEVQAAAEAATEAAAVRSAAEQLELLELEREPNRARRRVRSSHSGPWVHPDRRGAETEDEMGDAERRLWERLRQHAVWFYPIISGVIE